jgi:hypothetical protein
MRWIIGVLIALALAVGVFALWPDEAADSPSGTEAAGPSTTTTTAATSTSTTTPAGTTTITSDVDSHVVTTVEEAEEILRELWFGWFEGIYNQDEDRIREVVVLEQTVETAKESFGVEFDRAPQLIDFDFSETELLRSDPGCLAIWTVMSIDGFREGTTTGVFVMRWEGDAWSRLSTWIERNDMWEEDCDSLLR